MQVLYYPVVDTPRVVLLHDGAPRLGVGEHVELEMEDGLQDLWILEVRPLHGGAEYLATSEQSEVYLPELDFSDSVFRNIADVFIDHDEPIIGATEL